MTDFLPKDYIIPATSRYMRFEEGDNMFRILGSAITGMEYWKTVKDARKPIRLRPGISVQVGELEENPKTGEIEMPKHFWAFPVFNYAEKKVQILEITQKTIQKAIKSYVDNSKWGDPKQYDIHVTRTLENGKTTYSVMPDPKEEVDPIIVKEFEGTYIRLEALYDGEDPFFKEEDKVNIDEVAKEIDHA